MVGYSDYQILLQDFVALLQEEYGEEFISLVLYGSIARGEGKPSSDLDLILVISDAPPHYSQRTSRILKVLKRLEEIEEFHRLEREGYIIQIKPIILSRSEAEENRFLFLDVVEDGIILYDKEDFFANRLKALRRRLQELGSQRVRTEEGYRYWVLKPDIIPGEAFEL